ncbi:ABC transporter permease subunit [Bacillus timonensis]|nr:ABC transporter permease subunit [Bacillus timonensis]
MRKLLASDIPFWRDKRVIPILIQAVFVVFVLSFLFYFFSNALDGLAQLGIPLGIDFLQNTASFMISETLIQYAPTDTYFRALLVGFLNTLRVAIIGVILASIIGIIVGVARLSPNWMVNKVASIYTEIFRNTPLLVQIFIWYFAVFIQLPRIENSNSFLGTYFSNRGIVIPWFTATSGSTIWVICFIAGIVLSIFLWKKKIKKQVETGKKQYAGLWATGSFLLLMGLAYLITFTVPFHLSVPTIDGKQFVGGYRMTPEFSAILIGLVIYTSTYISEIVRGGILAVPKGQIEAANALGLKKSTTLRLVIFPQAIRVIIPPVTSQYLNLIKNSSLAVAVGYDDIVSIGNTVLNQTGRAPELISIMILVYLFFSLTTSFFMNQFNKRTQIVER